MGWGIWLVARDSSILGEETFLSRLCNLEDLGIKIREGFFLYHKKPLQVIERKRVGERDDGRQVRCPPLWNVKVTLEDRCGRTIILKARTSTIVRVF